MRSIVLVIIILFASSAKAGFFDTKEKGWHWYEIFAKPKGQKNKKSKENLETKTPTEQIESLKKEIEAKLHAAIVSPTDNNLKAYLLVQKRLMNQSQRFSENWQRVVYTNPEFDGTLEFPVENAARHLYLADEREQKKNLLQKLSKEYGLFFFFKGACEYCHGFAPHVASFAKKYNWDLIPISMDGAGIEQFPNAKHDNGVASRLNITHVPALIAVHPKTKKIIPLAYGMVSESEIENRVLQLVREGK